MYERFFQLRERPFALSPDPDYLYPSRVHQEALSYLRYGIEGHAGFVVITGEIGSGKTTLLQTLLGRLDGSTTVARLVNTMLEPRDLLEAIALDFGLDVNGTSKPLLIHRLAAFLVEQRQAGRLALLVIDEAQNLGLAALEEIRMLSNLETEKSKLLQIVLVGQPELRDALARPQLQQLRQRITVSYHLRPLDAADTTNYVNHRLRRAAAGPPLEFPPAVTALVYARSGGVPRVINVIADAVLLFAYGVDRRTIDLSIAQEAIAELEGSGLLEPRDGQGTVPAATAAADSAAGPAWQPSTAAPAGAARDDRLADRERALEARERLVVQQQRTLDDDARLLADARAALRPAEASRGDLRPDRAPVSPPAAAGTVALAPRLLTPSIAPRPAPRESLVTRLRHALFGISARETRARRA